jgi:DNA polymerase-3 subunit gamma/tau
MIVHARALLVVKIAGFDPELVQLPQSEGEALTRLAESFSEQDLVRFFSILTKTEQDIRTSSQPRFQLEIGLMKLVHARRLYLLEEALSRITDIQSRLGGAALPAPGSSQFPAVREGGKPAPSTGGHRPGSRSTQERPAQEFAPAARKLANESGPFTPQGFKGGSTGSSQRPAQGSDGGPRNAPSGSQKSQDAEMASRADFTVSQATEPPPSEPLHLLDAPQDYDLEQPVSSPQPTFASSLDGAEAVKKIIAALEAKNKMLIAMALEKAEVQIDGEFLRVSISPSNARDKIQMDGRDKRQAIEETAREVAGRKLTLSVSIGAQPQTDGDPKRKEATKTKEKAETNPKVKALADKFRAESIEIIKPER